MQAIVFSHISSSLISTVRAEGCSFSGTYDNDECVFYAGDASSTFAFYWTRSFESGVICAVTPVLIYNPNASMPLSDDSASIACDDVGIESYCAFDCSSSDNAAGMGIACR